MAPDIIQKNVRSWETSELRTLIVGLPSTMRSYRTQETFNRQQENNATINNTVDEIILNQNKKVSATNHESPEFLDSDYDANDLYQVDKMSLEETKKHLTDVSVLMNTKKTIHMGLKIKML